MTPRSARSARTASGCGRPSDPLGTATISVPVLASVVHREAQSGVPLSTPRMRVCPGSVPLTTRAVAGVRRFVSRTTLRGWLGASARPGLRGRTPAIIGSADCGVPPSSLVVREGSSATIVPTPTMMASIRSRTPCAHLRASGPVTHWLSPLDVAIRPSRLHANLETTNGRRWVTHRAKPAMIARASLPPSPTVTVTPASRRRATPRPATRGFGSSVAT